MSRKRIVANLEALINRPNSHVHCLGGVSDNGDVQLLITVKTSSQNPSTSKRQDTEVLDIGAGGKGSGASPAPCPDPEGCHNEHSAHHANHLGDLAEALFRGLCQTSRSHTGESLHSITRGKEG